MHEGDASHIAHWSPLNGDTTPDMMCAAENVWCILPFFSLADPRTDPVFLFFLQFYIFTLHDRHLYISFFYLVHSQYMKSLLYVVNVNYFFMYKL